MNIIEWKPYNFGECSLEFYDRHGNPFNGDPDKFSKLHKTLFGLKNETTGVVIIVNHFGEIAAKTPNKANLAEKADRIRRQKG